MSPGPPRTYRIAPNVASNAEEAYASVDIHLQLFAIGPDRAQVPLEVTGTTADPAGLLELKVIAPSAADPTTVLRAALRKEGAADPDRLL